jgi:hypothetical protein
MMRPTFLSAVVLALIAVTPTAPLRADVVGGAVAATPAVRVGDASGARTLVAGGRVRRGEVVETGPSGEAQLLFADGTRIVVGPQSRLVIDDVLVRPSGTAERFVGAPRGAASAS